MHTDHATLNSAIGWALGGGGLVALGGGVKWFWTKITTSRASREAKLDAREAEYVSKIEGRLKAVELLVDQQTKIIESQGKELERHRLAIALLVNDVAHHRPGATVLEQAKAILGAAFPLMMPTPAGINDLAAQIE